MFSFFFFFFFNDTATTEIYTLSLHDALPILVGAGDHYGPDDEQARAEQRPDSPHHDGRCHERAERRLPPPAGSARPGAAPRGAGIRSAGIRQPSRAALRRGRASSAA